MPRELSSPSCLVDGGRYSNWEDPFRIGGIRRKLGFYFILGASLRRLLIIRLLDFAAVASSSPFGTKCANETNLNERLPTRNGFLLR
ncbi:hypothetical protein AVEN_110750-1 [Araneus ventricosus]|uniref:Uncharacterized protein n=1 Tax=Araneus ventricosus TaxID=182803 RepID=A0A4Y2S204_ARAVE|nr:hypothetical protein AVEN_110750-1 [Araneus ventricosus]